MRGHRESHRKQTLVFTGTGVAVAPFQELTKLGHSGRLVRAVVRMEVGGGATACSIRVVNGAYTTSTTPATVADEDVAYEEVGIALTASATSASQDTNVALSAGGAHYAAREDSELLLLSVDVTAGAGAWSVAVTLYADEVE